MKVIYKKIEGIRGVYIHYKDINVIVLDPSLTNREENCVYTEEMGHYLLNATYNINCEDLNYISKQEHKARKYAFEKLTPLDKLQELLPKYERYEVAEMLDVADNFLDDAINYYIGKFGKI